VTVLCRPPRRRRNLPPRVICADRPQAKAGRLQTNALASRRPAMVSGGVMPREMPAMTAPAGVVIKPVKRLLLNR